MQLVYKEHLARVGYLLNAEETHLLSVQLPTWLPSPARCPMTPFRAEMKQSGWRERELDPRLEQLLEQGRPVQLLEGAAALDTSLDWADPRPYRLACENLRRANPALRQLTLEGGHRARLDTQVGWAGGRGDRPGLRTRASWTASCASCSWACGRWWRAPAWPASRSASSSTTCTCCSTTA